MVGINCILFLLGTSIASCHVLKHVPKHGAHFMPSVRLAPRQGFPSLIPTGDISHYLAHILPSGGNILYKPQFILPPALGEIMRLREDCKKHEHLSPAVYQLDMPTLLPIPIEEVVHKPVEIPEAPIFPPLAVPVIPEVLNEPEEKPAVVEVFPEPDLVAIPEAPILPPMSLPEIPPVVEVVPELKPEAIPEAPVLPPLPMPEIPVLVEPIAPMPVEIPEAPVLPPFVMPELPQIVVADNQVEPELIPEWKPIEIPEAPVLPPFEVPFEIPEAPVLPPLEIPEQAEVIVNEIPSGPVLPPFTMPEIPEAPILPPFIMPELPQILVPEKHIETEVIPEWKPIEIPEAPVLPPFEVPFVPFEIPEAPVLPPLVIPEQAEVTVNEISSGPVLPPFPMPEIPAPGFVESIEIPEAPVLPPFVMPELPQILVPENHIEPELIPEWKPIEIPEAPVLPPFEVPLVPIEIPEAPVLPPFVMPELPEVTVNEITSGPSEIFIPEAPVVPELVVEAVPEPEKIDLQEPIKIPPAPVLPPFELPVLSEVIAEPIVEYTEPKVPLAPVLPPLEVPAPHPVLIEHHEAPVPQIVAEEVKEPCEDDFNVNNPILIVEEVRPDSETTVEEVIPSLLEQNVGGNTVMIPALGSLSFPNFCVQNIIIDRALPNMIISEKDYAKSLATYSVDQYPMFPVVGGYYKR